MIHSLSTVTHVATANSSATRSFYWIGPRTYVPRSSTLPPPPSDRDHACIFRGPLYKSQMSLPQGPSHGSPQRAWTHRYDNAHNMSVDSLPLASPHAIWRCSRTGTRDSGPGMHKCKQSFLPVELLPMCASGLRYRGLTSSTLVGGKMDLAIASNVWN